MLVKFFVSEHQESGLHFSMSLQYYLYIALNHFLSNSDKRKHTHQSFTDSGFSFIGCCFELCGNKAIKLHWAITLEQSVACQLSNSHYLERELLVCPSCEIV